MFKHTVKFANGKTESIVGSDEIKKLVSPLKVNDGVVTQFDGEIASLWVIEHRCVQNETRDHTWIYCIRQLKEARFGGWMDKNSKEGICSDQ